MEKEKAFWQEQKQHIQQQEDAEFDDEISLVQTNIIGNEDSDEGNDLSNLDPNEEIKENILSKGRGVVN